MSDPKALQRARQKRYMERMLKEPDGPNRTRIQVLIDPHAAACLERLEKKTGMLKREVIEQAIIELADSLGCRSEE